MRNTRWRRRYVFAGALLPALAVALLPSSAVAGTTGGPTVPDRMAGYSHLTGTVSTSPPGRGIALFQFGFGVEFLDVPQAVVVGADGDVYRRVDLAEDSAGPETQGDPAPMLLSPDGTQVAVGDHDADRPGVAVVDLATGRAEVHPVPAGRSVQPAAWSPDGRRLAYLGTADATNPHAGTGPLTGDLGLLDLASGHAAALSGAVGVRTAAFSPDGAELAVQRPGGVLEVLPVDGGAGRTLDLPGGYSLAGPGAWSPDGDLLATTRPTRNCPLADSGRWLRCARGEDVITFVDATGSDRPTPDPLERPVVGPGRVLGWSSEDRVAVLVPDPISDDADPGQHRLIDVPLDGTEPRELSTLPTGDANYGVSRFQLATGLLSDLEVRPAGDADRGRWPLWLRIASAIGIAAAAAGASGPLLRRREDGQSAGSSTQSGPLTSPGPARSAASTIV